MFNFLNWKCGFSKLENFEQSLTFQNEQFRKFDYFPNYSIIYIFRIFQIGKITSVRVFFFQFWKLEIPKIGKFWNYSNLKILYNFLNCKILKIRLFFKMNNFKNLIISQISQLQTFFEFEIFWISQIGKITNFRVFFFFFFQFGKLKIPKIGKFRSSIRHSAPSAISPILKFALWSKSISILHLFNPHFLF